MHNILTQSLRAALLFALTAAPSQLLAQTWQWVTTQPTTTGTSQITAAARDGAGNIVVTGTISGTVTFGSTTLSSVGGQDIFVGRMSPNGAWLQAVRAGGTANDFPTRIAVDNAGNAVVVGRFLSPSLAFDATTLPNASASSATPTQDVFVARLSAAGQWTQALRLGGDQLEDVRGLVLDNAGTATILGYFQGPTLAVGSTTLTNADPTGTSGDVFLARLDAAGQWTQALRAGGPGSDSGLALAQDAAGTLHVGGIFYSPTIAFGSTTLANADASGATFDAFVARLSPAGTWTAAVRAGGASSNDQINALAVDGSGNVGIAGLYQGGATTFGTTTLSAPAVAGNYDPVVALLSPAGTWTMAARGATAGLGFPQALAFDTNGHLTVVGQLSGASSQFGSISVNSPGNTGSDFFLARLTNTGTWTYALRAGGNGVDNVSSVFLLGTTALLTGVMSATPTTFGFGSLAVNATSSTGYVGLLTGLVNAATGPRAVQPLTLAPNPAAGSVRLTWPTPAPQPRPVVVLDVTGREVLRQTAAPQATAATLDLSRLAPGLYVVHSGDAVGRLVVE